MRVVQTQITDTEHALLEAYARSRKRTIKETVREAIRTLTIQDSVNPEDPFFRSFPVAKRKGRHADASDHHDFYLYGREK